MSILDGQPVNGATDTAAFLSRISDSDTTAVVGLNNVSSGGLIPNTQQTINDNETESTNLRTLSGTTSPATDLGTFTGSTISDMTDIKSALQELETEVETKVDSVNGNTGVVVLNIDDVTPTTTKGDIIADDGTNAVRLPVGTNGQVLTANSAVTEGVEWSDPAASSVDSDQNILAVQVFS